LTFFLVWKQRTFDPQALIIFFAGERVKIGSFSSSGRSDSSGGGPGNRVGGTSSGNETEEGEVKARHLLLVGRGAQHQPRVPKVWVKLRHAQHQQHDQSCSTEGQRSSDEEDDEEEEDEEEDAESNSSAFSGDGDASPVHVTRSSKPRAIRGVANNLKMRIISGQKQRFVTRPGGSLVVGVPMVATRRRSMRRGDQVVLARRGFSAKTLRYAANLAQVQHQGVSDDEEDEEEETGEVSDQEEAITQHMKIVHAQKSCADRCEVAETDDEDDDDEDDDDDEADDDEESSEYISSPDSAHGCGHQACVNAQNRRNVAEVNAKPGRRRSNCPASEDDPTPKCKRPKPEVGQVAEEAGEKSMEQEVSNSAKLEDSGVRSTTSSKQMNPTSLSKTEPSDETNASKVSYF
jgi:hypothetical protein